MNVTLALTHQCNLACSYCYAGRKFRSAMPLETARKALDLAFGMAGPQVQVLLFGGEPLLEPALVDAVAVESRQRAATTGKAVRLVITTNGTLLDDKRVDLLARHRFCAGVSLDGVEAAHNAARRRKNGTGSWKAVVKGVKALAQRLDQVETISVVHPGNVELLPESFDFLASLGLRRMAFNLDYSAPWDAAALARLSRAYEDFTQRVLAHYRAGNDFLVHPLHPKIVSHLKGGFSPADRCDFGCKEIAVAPSGNIYPCDRLIGEDGGAERDVVIGHVDTGVDERRVTALKEPKDRPKEDCEGCAILDRCMWWCGCVNRALTRHVDRVSDVLCDVEQIYVRAADAVAGTLFQEKNRPFLERYYLAAGAVDRGTRSGALRQV